MKFRSTILFICIALAACASRPRTPLVLEPAAGEPPGVAGLAAAEVKAMYGEPSFVRKDGPTEIWRYDAQNCRVFFFLYPKDGGEVVRHVETLPRGQTMAVDSTCLGLLHGRGKVS